MTRTIATLIIALLIGAGTEAEAQTGMTVETVYLYLTEEDFKPQESGDHKASYGVPEITQAAWEGGMVFVHHCMTTSSPRNVLKMIENMLSGQQDQKPSDIDTEATMLACEPLGKDSKYSYSRGILLYTHDQDDSVSNARQARNELLRHIAFNPILRVTIIAPAQ